MIGFADEATSLFGDWSFGGRPDVLVATEVESGDGSGFLDLRAHAHLPISCILRPASEVATDISPKGASNEDTSTRRFENCLSFLAGGVSLS